MTESSERENRACAFVAKQIGNMGAKQRTVQGRGACNNTVARVTS